MSKKSNWVSGIKLTILAVATISLITFVIGAAEVVFIGTYYRGDIVITDEQQLVKVEALITATSEAGPLGIWNPSYTMRKADGGQVILRYSFYALDKNLPLTRAK